METRGKATQNDAQSSEEIVIQLNDNENVNTQIHLIKDDNQEGETLQEQPSYKLMPLPQARSEVWSYFGFIANEDGHIVEKNRVICRLCGLSFCYSGNTTNFYSHLRAIHSDINLKRTSHPPAKNANQSLNTSTVAPSTKSGNKRSLENDEQFDEFQENHSQILTNTAAQSSTSTKNDSSKPLNDEYFIPSQSITETLLNFIVNDCRPVDVLYGRGFQKVLNLLAPGYLLPAKSKLLMELRRKYDQLQRDKNILDIDKSLAS